MKNTYNKLFEKIVNILLVLTLILDYFPEIGISYKVSAVLMIVFIGLAVVTQNHSESPINKPIKLQVVTLTGIMLMLLLLTLIGGESQNGLNLDSPIIWVLYAGSLFGLFLKYKKRNKLS